MVFSCFGKLCAKEASKQPKKRYNEYVPAVFPTEAPDWRSPISAGTTRNISTVQDYVGENIQRAPKVSRRLWRRIGADHSNDVALGQVGVHCYIGLLSSMSEGDTSLLAEEIIRRDDSVVPLLLSARGDAAEDNCRRILGLELLVHFIRAQSSSDVSRLLAEYTQKACMMLQQGGCAERDSAALRVLREYVNYTSKHTIPCEHLPTIQSTAQDWLLRDSKETGVTALDPGFIQSLQFADMYTTPKTSRVAQAVLQELSLLCQDATVGAQVVANGLQSISSHRAWDGGSRQQVTLQELRAGQQASGTQLLLLSGLLNELGSPSLQEGATPVVLHAAAQEASSLPSSLAPSALAKILTATAPLLPLEDSAARGDASQALRASQAEPMVELCVRGLASQYQEPEQLLESVATTLSSADLSDSQAAIRKVKAANIAIRCLQSEGESNVQAPTALYTELCRLATLPEQAPGGAPLALQAAATCAVTDALQLSGGPLKPAAVQLLLQNVDHQLAPTARHTPSQLAAAAELHSALAARAPVEGMVQSANAAVPRMGGAAAAPRGVAAAVEVICTNQHCLNAAFQRMQSPQPAPALLPPRSCNSLQQDPNTGKLVATVEQALAMQPPPVAASGTGAAAGATWAPNAAALADAAAIEDGDGFVLESADTLTGSGMEGQRREEASVQQWSTPQFMAWQHVQEYSDMPVSAMGGLPWGAGAVKMVADYRNGTPRLATPGVTTPAGTNPGGTTDDMDAFFMIPPSPGAAPPLAPPVPFSPGACLQDHMHGAAAAGQVTPGEAGGALPAAGARTQPTAPGTASLAPVWGLAASLPAQASHSSAAAPTLPPQPAPTMQPLQPRAAHRYAHAAPQLQSDITSLTQPGAPLGNAPAARSAMSSASGDPSTSLNGMLVAPAGSVPTLDTQAVHAAAFAPDSAGSAPADDATAPGISAAQLANRRVYKPAVSSSAASAAATGVPQLGGIAQTSAQAGVLQLGGGVSQMSVISVVTEATKNGTHIKVHGESLSLPLGPPPRTNNKPLHVLPPTSPLNKPPKDPSGLLDGHRDSSAWSPPPAITIRSLHALPGGPDSHRGITPTSSIGDVSSWSRLGIGRSVHAVSKDGNERSHTELLTPGRGSAAPGSPSGMSTSSVTSGSRRRGRPSLHVLRGRDACAPSAPLDAATAPV